MTFTRYVLNGLHFNCSPFGIPIGIETKHEIAKYIKNGNVFINKYILKNILLD